MDSIRNLGLNILEYLGVNNYDKITDNIYLGNYKASEREVIDKETENRNVRKKAEKEEHIQREKEHRKARKLEKLFNYKLEAFEVEDIKNSTNRKLKGKLRRAKSRIEVDMWSIMILQEQLQLDKDTNKDS